MGVPNQVFGSLIPIDYVSYYVIHSMYGSVSDHYPGFTFSVMASIKCCVAKTLFYFQYIQYHLETSLRNISPIKRVQNFSRNNLSFSSVDPGGYHTSRSPNGTHVSRTKTNKRLKFLHL